MVNKNIDIANYHNLNGYLKQNSKTKSINFCLYRDDVLKFIYEASN